MSASINQSGYFLFTLDTELAWGHFDAFNPGMFSVEGKRERAAIQHILDMLDEFDLTSTWAVVGHLFYERCEECQICPVLDWQGKYDSFSQIYKTNKPLWYGADIIDLLLQYTHRHEIAFHGYTHRIFNENTLSEQEASIEISEWLRVAERKNVPSPTAVVFPRNRTGYLSKFEEYGFKCYRGDELLPTDYYSLPIIGKLLNRIDIITQLRTPQVYPLPKPTAGIINLPASRGMFRVNPHFERLLEHLKLGHLPAASLIRGVEKAAREKSVFHLYAHPYEFSTDKNFEKLRRIFSAVGEKVRSGDLQTVSMSGLTDIINFQQG
jgi:peptidoglycan/xylan/chitin deacetylase (PgdA/CDA1 family)